jgi:hypothetical protein
MSSTPRTAVLKNSLMYAAFVYGSFSFLAAASVYFLVRMRIRYIIYSAVIFLTLLQIVGAFFKIMHMPGADQLLILGFAGTIIGGGLLIWRSVWNEGKGIIFNKLMVGLMLLVQLALVFFPVRADQLGSLLNYPITALIATVLINDQSEHQGERNMMIVFLMQAVFYIASELLKSL